MHSLVNIRDEGIGRLNAFAGKGKRSHAAEILRAVKEHLRKDVSIGRLEGGCEIPASKPTERHHHVQELIAPFEIVELDAFIAASAADIRHTVKMKLLNSMLRAAAQVSAEMLAMRIIRGFPAAMPGIRDPYLQPYLHPQKA